MLGASQFTCDLNCSRCARRLIINGKLKCLRCKTEVLATLGQEVIFCPNCSRPRMLLAKRDEAICPKKDCVDENRKRTKTRMQPQEHEMIEETGTSELSCREAKLILKITPLTKSLKVTKKNKDSELTRACQHYVNCDACRRKGLSAITGKTITCQDALEAWAAKPGPLYLMIDVETLREALAVEHVWGRLVDKGEYMDQHFKYCDTVPCRQLRLYWQGAPLSCHYDGERETAEEIPFLIKLFIDQDVWSLSEILKIQKKRIDDLLKDLANTDKEGFPGKRCGYHSRENIEYELKRHVEALQGFMLDELHIEE